MLPTLCKQMSKERPIHWTSFHLGSCSSTFVHARCLTKQRLTILIFCKTNIRREISTLDESQPWVSVSLLDLCSARCLSKTKGNVTLMYSIVCQDVPHCWYNLVSSWGHVLPASRQSDPDQTVSAFLMSTQENSDAL